MASKAKFIPEGYNTVTPYLIVEGAARALAFYKKAFGAKEVMRFDGPDGKVGHAEIRIGNSPIMLADEFPDMGAKGPQAFGGSPVSLHLYVEDVDGLAKQAVAAGAKLTRPVEDQFYGDRLGSVTDPFGHVWHIATHKEDLSPEEMKKRADKYMKEQVKA
jgi:PhnB protein